MTEAWVTLATNDVYALGCQVLGHSLRKVETSKKLAVMVTPGVSEPIRDQLASVFDHVIPVNILDSNDTENLELIKRPDLGVTFTKLHCWRLTQFTKCVFLDADTLVVKNSDELFEREELSASPDIGWPDMFNSGVFVFTPSRETYHALLEAAVSKGSFDGGDQGLLNSFFSGWARGDTKFRLPFVYNMSLSASYGYAAAIKQFGKDIKIVHFLGAVKPWHHTYNTATNTVQMRQDSGCSQEHLELWWSIFASHVMKQQFHRETACLRASSTLFRFDDFCAYPSAAVVQSVITNLPSMGDSQLKVNRSSRQEEKEEEQQHHIQHETDAHHVHFVETPDHDQTWSVATTTHSKTESLSLHHCHSENCHEVATKFITGEVTSGEVVRSSSSPLPLVSECPPPPPTPISRVSSADSCHLDDELPTLTPANAKLLWLSNQGDIDTGASEIGDPDEMRMAMAEVSRGKQYGSGGAPDIVHWDDRSGPGGFVDLSYGGPPPTASQRGLVLEALLGSPFDPMVTKSTEADLELEEMVKEADEPLSGQISSDEDDEDWDEEEFLPPLTPELRDLIEKIVAGQPSTRNLVFAEGQASHEEVAEMYHMLSISGGAQSDGRKLTDRERQNRWENGQIDYTGADSFAAIQQHMAAKLE